MANDFSRTVAEKLIEKNGIAFYRINNEKFKTTRIDLFFQDQLSKERASANALLPSMMKRGCKSYPTMSEMERKLEQLYGADLDGGVVKKGEMQFIGFHMSHISDRFALSRERLFDDSSKLLMCMLENPITEGKAFKDSLFRQERDNLVDYIRSRVNDKMRYTLNRCIEEMCEGEPFSISEDGSEENALLLTPQNTYQFYEKMISNYPAYVYISGEADDKSVQSFVDNFLSSFRTCANVISQTVRHHLPL